MPSPDLKLEDFFEEGSSRKKGGGQYTQRRADVHYDDAEHQREEYRRFLEHAREKELAHQALEKQKLEFDQNMITIEKRHARRMNIGAALFIGFLVLSISLILIVVSFGVSIPWLGIQSPKDPDGGLRKLAISSLGPLAGLSIGFFSGKIKWPG